MSSSRLPLARRSRAAGRSVCLGDHGAARLPYLGPAFGTKFPYFCSSTGLAFNEVRWSVSTYVRYLETMVGWADELALAADQLEACIFSTQAGSATPNGLSPDHAAPRSWSILHLDNRDPLAKLTGGWLIVLRGPA